TQMLNINIFNTLVIDNGYHSPSEPTNTFNVRSARNSEAIFQISHFCFFSATEALCKKMVKPYFFSSTFLKIYVFFKLNRLYEQNKNKSSNYLYLFFIQDKKIYVKLKGHYVTPVIF